MTTTHALNKRIALQPAVNRTVEARRVYNLRRREDRETWQRLAYEPRLDMGETPALKPGYHEDDEWGWYEGGRG